jgi:hypothetical protein
MLRLRAPLFILTLLLSACSGDEDNIVRECILLQPNQDVKLLRDLQYARYRFFDLGVIGGVDYVEPGDSLIALFVHQSAGVLNLNLPEAVAYPNVLAPESSPDSVRQRFRQLNIGYEWEIHTDVPSGRFTLVFPEPLQGIETTTVAYYMEVKKLDGTFLTFGSYSRPGFSLQMLKYPNSLSTDPLWAAEWKNVYDLGPGPLSWHSMDIELFRAPFGLEDAQHSYFREQNGLSFLYLLGLDRFSPFSEDTAGDGRVDNDPDILWLDQGLLVFPLRTPFTEPALTEQVPQLYSTDDLGTLVASSKYYLKVTKSGYRRSVRLTHINLIEGSDRVEAGGVVLTRGVHYYIDYQVGEIEFISDEVTTLGGPIQICYEYEKFL